MSLTKINAPRQAQCIFHQNDDWNQLSSIIENIKSNFQLYQKRTPIISFTASCFDLFHAGHALMLGEAASISDLVIVALQTDPTIDRPEKNKPIQSFEERKTQISFNRNVDYMIEYTTEKELLTILEKVKPDIRVLGTDYIGKTFTGYELGIPIHWANRDHGYSTSGLRRLIYEAEKAKMNPPTNAIDKNNVTITGSYITPNNNGNITIGAGNYITTNDGKIVKLN